MKKIFSLTLALLASGSSFLFAQSGRSNAPLQLRLSDNSPVTILVDGTNYANEGGMLSVNSVVPGEHEIQVFRGALREGTRVPAIKTFKVTTTAQGSTVCVVDPVSGAVDIQNAGQGGGRSGNGNDRNGSGFGKGDGRGGDRGGNGQDNNSGTTTTGGTSTPDTSKRHLLARERNRTLSRAYLDNLNKSGLQVAGETVQTGTIGSGNTTNNNQSTTNNNGGTRGGNGSGRGNGAQGNTGTNNQGNASGQNDSGNGRGNSGTANPGNAGSQNSSGNNNNGNQSNNSGQNGSGNYGRGNNNDRGNGSQNNGNSQWGNDGWNNSRNNTNSGTQTRADQSNGNSNGYDGQGDSRGGQWNSNQGNNGNSQGSYGGNYNNWDDRGSYNDNNRDGNWSNGGGRRDDDRDYNGRNKDREEEIREPELILLKAKDITAIKAKVAKKSTDASKNTLLQSEIGDRAFTVEQGRGLLRLLKGETARLQFARWAIDGTIDVENFGKLATEFKLAASKREIKKLAADAQEE